LQRGNAASVTIWLPHQWRPHPNYGGCVWSIDRCVKL